MDRKLEVYQAENGEWSWRIRAANGNIIATAGETYANKGHAERMGASMLPAEQE